jgi:hypothetical protein
VLSKPPNCTELQDVEAGLDGRAGVGERETGHTVFNVAIQHRATQTSSTEGVLWLIFSSYRTCQTKASLHSAREEAVMAGTLTLDTIISASTFFAGQWSAMLKGNQSRDVLRLVVSKLYGASHGSLFHARIRCSHSALADACDLSREWTCTLIGRLRQAGWIETHAPRLPDGKQEVTTFRAGRMLKRLLVMLMKSRQRHPQQHRVNDRKQELPTREEMVRNKALLADLLASLSQKLGPPGKKRAW